MQKAIETHHISHEPEITEKIPRRKHQEIHGIAPIDTLLSRKMREYDAITKLIVIQRNWLTAFEKDFGLRPTIGLEHCLKLKGKKMDKVGQLLGDSDLQKVKHIKGLGTRYLAGILAYANPRRFSTLGRFLFYCGYRGGNCRVRCNRKVKSIVYQIVSQLLMHKDTHYYAFYKKFRNGEMSHKEAMNRVGTFLLKEIYKIFHGAERKIEGLVKECTIQK